MDGRVRRLPETTKVAYEAAVETNNTIASKDSSSAAVENKHETDTYDD